MENKKISCITPTVRPLGLPIINQCLKRQSMDYEWVIVAPEQMLKEIVDLKLTNAKIIAEPPKNEGDFYCLNKAWNKAYQTAMGELFIDIVDWIWFPPDTLERFWNHYLQNRKVCITAIGHQYKEIVNGKPEGLVWNDPRARSDFGTFYEVAPTEMEMCLASLPRQAIIDCGGLDEEYDKGAAIGEKEMCYRLRHLGYQFYIEQSIEYRALQHPRLSENWDEMYKITSAIFDKHMKELKEEKRLLNVSKVK
jgi:hypothetical protein